MTVIEVKKKNDTKREKDVESDLIYMNKVAKTMKPLIILQSIFCVNRSLTPITKFNKVRHLIFLAIVVAGTIQVCFERMSVVYGDMKIVPIITDVLSLIVLACTVFCNIYISTFHSTKMFRMFYLKGENLVKMLQLDEDVIWKHGRTTVLKMIILNIVPLMGIFIYDFIKNYTSYNMQHALLYVINYTFTLANALISLQFICSLAYCRQVFSIVNLKLATIYDTKYNKNMSGIIVEETKRLFIQDYLFWIKDLTKSSLISIKAHPCRIKEAIECYFLNCEQCEHFNTFYKEQNLLMTTNSLIAIVKSLYTATNQGFFNKNRDGNLVFNVAHLLSTCLLVLHDVTMLFGITAACEIVMQEAKKVTSTVDSLLFYSSKDEREDLTLWSNLMHRKLPIFTACNCFYINFSLLYQIGATVITYLIILIQMKDF